MTTSRATASSSTTTAVNLGLLDFFSEEARAKRAERVQAEREEQEQLQAEILERRANPEKMAEYEARVAIRRKAYKEGKDGYAYVNEVMKDQDK